MDLIKEENKAKIVKMISKKPMNINEIVSKTGLHRSTIITYLQEIKKEHDVQTASTDPKNKNVKYYSIGIKIKSIKEINRDNIYNLISKKYYTRNELSQKTGINKDHIIHYIDDLRKLYDVEMIRVDIGKSIYAFGIGLGEVEIKYPELPPKISDIFLITWADKKPELYGKSTREIINLLKKEGTKVYRFKDDGEVYYL